MVWKIDRTYTFSVVRLLEGFLNIEKLTISAAGLSWDLVDGGVDQGITPAIHPGDAVSMSMIVKNASSQGGRAADNFIIITTIGTGTPEQSPIIPLALDVTANYAPSSFIMPDKDISVKIETFHEIP